MPQALPGPQKTPSQEGPWQSNTAGAVPVSPGLEGLGTMSSLTPLRGDTVGATLLLWGQPRGPAWVRAQELCPLQLVSAIPQSQASTSTIAQCPFSF